MTANSRTIILEVGEWAKQQPWGESSGNPRHAPDYGVVEEFGELMHCVLKRKQGIRGMDNSDTFKEKATDALGDIMVYLSHWCYLNDAYYTINMDYFNALDERLLIQQVLLAISQLVQYSTGEVVSPKATAIAIRVANTVAVFSHHLGYDILHDCLFPTWEKVKQRNWNKDKIAGGEVKKSLSLQTKPSGEIWLHVNPQNTPIYASVNLGVRPPDSIVYRALTAVEEEQKK